MNPRTGRKSFAVKRLYYASLFHQDIYYSPLYFNRIAA